MRFSIRFMDEFLLDVKRKIQGQKWERKKLDSKVAVRVDGAAGIRI